MNVLVYAYRREAEHHEQYASWLQHAVSGPEDLGLLEGGLIGFVRIVTHPRVFADPAPTVDAFGFVDALRRSPNARSLSSGDATWARVAALAAQDRAVRANLVLDAHLAAVAIVHGARVATADRGFARFPGVQWFDPIQPAA